MLIFWPIMLFSNAPKIPNNAQEVHLLEVTSRYLEDLANIKAMEEMNTSFAALKSNLDTTHGQGQMHVGPTAQAVKNANISSGQNITSRAHYSRSSSPQLNYTNSEAQNNVIFFWS